MKGITTISILLFFLLSFIAKVETTREPVSTEVELGKELFFDKILSLDRSISCASCHQPEFAFADTLAFSKGVGDSIGLRNTPSVMNMAFRPYFFYDGRAATLEEQAIGPIEDPLEMHLDFITAIQRVQETEFYLNAFDEIYSSAPDSALVLKALAEFIRSLESDGSAPHDLWLNDIDSTAMSASQIRGRALFRSEKAKCFDCHFSPDFTGDEFRNTGLFDGSLELNDSGRFKITKDSTDLGKFKVPGLRNVALTAPYMHNGQFKTLEEVVEYYDDPYKVVANPINMDTLMLEPLQLSSVEKQDLVNFLHALTDTNFPVVETSN